MVEEYFAREKRRHPVWKSESEFKALFVLSSDDQTQRAVDTLKKEMADIIALLKEKGRDPILSKDTLDFFQSELESIKTVSGKLADRRIRNRNRQIRFLQNLENYCAKSQIAFDFVLLDQKGFTSGFGSSNIGQINVVFDEKAMESYHEFQKVSAVLRAGDEPEKMFYLFHHRASDENFPKSGLIDFLKHKLLFDDGLFAQR